MKGISLFLVATAFTFGQTGQIVKGWTGGTKIMSGSIPIPAAGLMFNFETRLDPSTPPIEGLGEGGASSITRDGEIRRIMVDRGRKLYFGYEVKLERLEQPHAYRIGFKKLRAVPTERGITPEWSSLEPPWYPEPQVIHLGDVIAMTLLVNPATQQKIIDYITITETPVRQPAQARQATPADGTAPPLRQPIPDDGTIRVNGLPNNTQSIRVEGQDATNGLWRMWGEAARTPSIGDKELRLETPRLTINGKEDASSVTHPQNATGAKVWFYTADAGRFVLSLTPNAEAGFKQLGSVQGNHLAFGVGGNLYALDCADRITSASGVVMLYVLQERNWRPAGNTSDFMIGTDK